MLTGHAHSTRDARRARGFTLIELMVTVSIFAILVGMAVPSMNLWIANTKVRTVADTLQNGIRLAQAESLRRSRQVVFALTNSASPAPGFTATTQGSYWAVQTVPLMTDGSDPATVIATGALPSVGGTVNITAGQNQSALCFNSLGRLATNSNPGVANATCTAQPMFTYVVAATGADHALQVEVALGGQLHLCDSAQTLSASNPYGC